MADALKLTLFIHRELKTRWQAIEKACEMLADGGNNSVEVVSIYEEAANAATEPFAVSAEYIREMEKLGREHAAWFVIKAEEIIRTFQQLDFSGND